MKNIHVNKRIVKHSNMLEGKKSAKEAAFFMNPHILRGMGGGVKTDGRQCVQIKHTAR